MRIGSILGGRRDICYASLSFCVARSAFAAYGCHLFPAGGVLVLVFWCSWGFLLLLLLFFARGCFLLPVSIMLFFFSMEIVRRF